MRTETFETPGQVSLDIRLGAGEVRLETDEVGETTVELEPLRDNDPSREAVEEARLELRTRAERHEIVIDVREPHRTFGWGRGAEVLVRVRSPHGTDVEYRTGSADIEGHGRFGALDIETGSGEVQFDVVERDAKVSAASGDVQVKHVGGDARLTTASGDIQVSAIGGDAKLSSASGDIIVREVAGELDANSASGDVLVKEARSSVSVNTASGDQSIGSVAEGSASLKSASGDLRIGIRQGSRLWVDAKSRSGEVSSELDVSETPPEGDAPLVELRANTMSGDISIVRASA